MLTKQSINIVKREPPIAHIILTHSFLRNGDTYYKITEEDWAALREQLAGQEDALAEIERLRREVPDFYFAFLFYMAILQLIAKFLPTIG